jgi:two-component system, cell cycle sensor histidine kinase and response regulator CckA
METPANSGVFARDAEAQLREEQERHRRLLDLLDDGVASIDANGCFLAANSAMARMLGYDSSYDLRGVSLRDVYAGPGAVDVLLERLASHSTVPRAEAELLCLGGERITVLLRARSLGPPADGRAVAEIVCTDITAERRLEHEARRSEHLLLAGTLAAGVGIEMERLLGAIAGGHTLLAEVIGDDHVRRPDLQYLRDTTAKAAALIEELLAATRRRGARPAVLDACLALERLHPALQQTSGGEISMRVPQSGYAAGQVAVAPGELDQVVLELTSSARALDPHSPITIATGPVYLDATYAREHVALTPGHYVAFVITTSTQSIETLLAPDWESERSFTRGAADRKIELELATVYRTLTQAGGHLSVRRAPGTGTTFKGYLPRVDTPGHRGTILLVEDEPSIRCGGRQLLELLDYRVLEAGDPHEAIWLASRFGGDIDLLIADVVLPGMSGPEMAQRLVEAGYVSRVLYMSGLLKETLVERATLPADAVFIEKPFTMAQLTTHLREMFGGDGAA